MATKRSVVLKGRPEVSEEGVASGAIKPGYLVKGVSTVAVQTASDRVVTQVALERDELGQGIDNTYQNSGTEAASYASGDRVKTAVFKAGEEAIGYVASGQNISEDDLLSSAGDGTYKEEVTAEQAIARAMETVGAVTVETKIRIQFI